MSGFISRAACRGRRPSRFAAASGFQRSVPIARLLKERSVARFIVAPDGYGKSMIALDYAETMFDWNHVFWINAQSPCFIRDLDGGIIASECMETDSEAALVIIDDLPLLDADRSDRFSQELDRLLTAECEVLVTCTPSCDLSGKFQYDRVRIGASDLLLDDRELDEARSSDDRARRPAESVGPAERVPALVWGAESGGADSFIHGIAHEEMPSDMQFAICTILVLQHGSVRDLADVFPFDREMLAGLALDYPHLGLDSELSNFKACVLQIEPLMLALRNRLEDMAARFLHSSRDALAGVWADVLLRNHQAERACDLVRLACSRPSRARWLVSNAVDLVSQVCFYPALRLAEHNDDAKGFLRMRVISFEALCRRILGDDHGALQLAQRYAFDYTAPEDVRVVGLLIIVKLGAPDLSARALVSLGEMAMPAIEGDGISSAWALLARARCAGMEGPIELAQVWEQYRAQDCSHIVLSLCAAWLFNLLERPEGEIDADRAVQLGLLQRPVETYVAERLSQARYEPIDFFAASAGLAMEEARSRGVRYDGAALSAAAMVALRNIEMSVLSQRRLFEHSNRASKLISDDWMITHPDLSSSKPEFASVVERRHIPTLTIKMFGRFEVQIGDTVIDQACFRRQNARSLLVLLAANQGRELSRDSVTRAMWPHSSAELARKNFYTVWAQLRRALTLPDGTCPYLIRHQFGCSLEQRYVQSDIERLGEICRELLFGTPDIDHWSQLFIEVDRDFSSDLMPSETKNTLVIQTRNEYRARLIDALVAATLGVIDRGSPQWGVWFARAALTHDETREDAYVALMQAQIAGNQRTAAMMTYLKCRRVLSDQLGIDPSPETTALYESLLDADGE